jgi:uncharacterized membrane protein YhaH (DUF805 family)
MTARMARAEGISTTGGGKETTGGSMLIGAIGVIVLVLVAPSLASAMGSAYGTWGAILVAPVLLAITLPILARQAAREEDRTLFWILALALVFKLVGALVRDYVAFDVYGGSADATHYHEWGLELAPQFRQGDFDTGLESLVSTDFIRFFTGIVYAIIGPTRLGGFLFYSWLGFLGLFFFYRAFRIAVPEGRGRSYAWLLFFLPSLLFWPSSIGKEAWMMFALGIAAFGAARILSGSSARGFVPFGIGLWLAALVRPHIAGLLALSMAAGYFLKRPERALGPVGPVVKTLGLAVLAIVAGFLVLQADEFLQESGINTGTGVTSVLEQTAERTEQGGSQFAPSILESPARTPEAVASVLFRPFVTEAHNAQSALAALEGTFILILTLVRLRWMFHALRSVRRLSYVGFAFVYTGLMILAFSSIANFGLLARQRVQLLPVFLVLLLIPPRQKEEDAGDDRETRLARP